MLTPFEKAKKFTQLMDDNRYDEAGSFISPDCRYRYRGDTILGRDAILKSYSDNYESAAKMLDKIEFLSEIEALGANVFRLKYLDRIRKGEATHDHKCEQLVTFVNGQIAEIEHIDLFGEKKSLEEFFRKTGIQRS